MSQIMLHFCFILNFVKKEILVIEKIKNLEPNLLLAQEKISVKKYYVERAKTIDSKCIEKIIQEVGIYLKKLL